MKNRCLLEYNPESGACRWLRYLESGPDLPAHTGELEDFFAAHETASIDELLLVVNSARVAIRTVAFEPQERRHILKTASFELEESLVSDLEELHVAYAKPGERTLTLAVVDKAFMHALLEPFTERHIKVVGVLPLVQLLDGEQGQWSVNAGEDTLSVKLSEHQQFVTSYAQARLAWTIAARDHESLPSLIRLYQDSDAAAQQLEDCLPNALQSLVQATGTPWFARTQWAAFSRRAINLLQGEFSPSVPWVAIWQFWRLPLIFLAVGVLVYTLSAYLDNRRLHAENLHLRQQMTEVYRQAFPNSQVSDPEQQMRSKLREFSSGGEQSRFLPLFYQSAEVLKTFEGIKLLNVNFTMRTNELRLDIMARQFEDIEKIRSSLAEQGIAASLVSSNSVEGGERARMIFKESGGA